jgi:hypothetical protein
MNSKTINSESPKLHSHWLSDAIGSAWKLAKLGIQSDASSAMNSELAALTAPHLAVLVYKHAKYAGEDARWKLELHHFVERTIIPQLAEDPALAGLDADQLASRVDAVVMAEQRRLAKLESDPLPSTSRFDDTSWAT